MLPTLDNVMSLALALPPEQRVVLAEQLWLSVGAPSEDNELFAEIERREADISSGVSTPISYDQAMREIRDALP